MAQDLLAYDLLPVQVSEIVSLNEAATLSDEAVTLYDLTTGEDVTGGATVDSEVYDEQDANTNDIRLWFQWTPDMFTAAPDADGDVKYVLRASSSVGKPVQVEGRILVWPEFSLLDRYLGQIQDFVSETEAGASAARLGKRGYRNALRTALRAYNVFPVPVTAYVLTHTSDTLPAADFESVTLYAAGVALAGPLANQASRTEANDQSAGLVSYRDQQQRLRQQGRDWMQMARELWAAVDADDGVQTGALLLADPSPWQAYVSDLEESLI